MRLIRAVERPCDCQGNARRFQESQPGGKHWSFGTAIECDCGNRLVLVDSALEGPYWSRVRTRRDV